MGRAGHLHLGRGAFLAAGLALACAAAAEPSPLRFGRAWSSHMVVQRGEPVPFAGFGETGRTVRVAFGGTFETVAVGADGAWRVQFPAVGAPGGPYEVVASDGAAEVRLTDVLVGDVWFCTGQSNAWWPLARSGNPERELAAADCPDIRLLDVPLLGSEAEVDEPPYVRGWTRLTPQTARDFSALACHFARAVRERLGDVPIGLVGAAWPGPPIRHFLPSGQRDPQALARSRDALRAAADGFARADAAIAEAHALFGDAARLKALATASEAEDGEPVSLPAAGGLEHTVLKDFAGIAAFSREVEVPGAWTGRDLALDLGQSALPCVIFFNGARVGASKAWDAPVPGETGARPWRFRVPAAAVKAGSNAVTAVVGCRDRLTWWGAFSGTLTLAPADAPQAAFSLAGAGWRCRRSLAVPKPPRTYGGSWGACIRPFFRLPVKGVLFYQGEADAQARRDCAAYLADLSRLISLLRAGWGRPDLPFYGVQLANHEPHRADETWSEIREAQRLASVQIPGVGFACSIDIGSRRDIHPPDKREQGRRLARQALAKTYGCRDVVADGPQAVRVEAEGRTAIVAFAPPPARPSQPGGALPGFEAQDASGAWHAAEAAFADGGRVRVTAPFAISGVRSLWRNFPEPGAAIFGATGLPAGPFRVEGLGRDEDLKKGCTGK